MMFPGTQKAVAPRRSTPYTTGAKILRDVAVPIITAKVFPMFFLLLHLLFISSETSPCGSVGWCS